MSRAAKISLPDPTGAYRSMLRLRGFEEQAYRLFMQNLVMGTMHLGVGQEAVAVGVGSALGPQDYVYSTYRGHMHVLERGASLEGGFAELLGRSGGLCKGKGGSMHFTDVEHGAMCSNAIVGAHLPIACGSAWSARLRGTDQVSVAFFGDGACNIGTFHEALNLAAVWKLPVLFICENNLYMEYTPIGSVTAVPHPAADRAAAYGLSGVLVDGNDVEAVYEVAREAVSRARAGGGPSLIEAETYRHMGHSRTDPAKYRPDEELQAWKERDPVPSYRARLLAAGVGSEQIAAIEAEVDAEIEGASARAVQ